MVKKIFLGLVSIILGVWALGVYFGEVIFQIGGTTPNIYEKLDGLLALIIITISFITLYNLFKGKIKAAKLLTVFNIVYFLIFYYAYAIQGAPWV